MTDDKESGWTEVRFCQSLDDLKQYGPSIPIEVSAAIDNAPKRIRALALVDTGAAGTGIGPDLAKRLGLPLIGRGMIHEAGRAPIMAGLHRVRLCFPSIDIDVDVTALPSLGEPHDVLIGRDVMAKSHLYVDFLTGKTRLAIKTGA